jgi:hypothetical protein
VAIAARRLVPADKGLGFAAGADVVGAALVTGALMIGVYTIVKPAAEEGWLAGQTLGLGATSIGLLVVFVARQARAASPLMPLGLFRSRNLVGANLIQAIGAAGMFGTFFLGTLYLQNLQHYDALEIGLAFLPATLIMGVLSLRFAEPLIMRFGARRSLLVGLVLIAAGLALFTRAPVHGGYVQHVLPVMVVIALGIGVCFPALMTLAMSGATAEDSGLASGLVNTTQQVGGALGLAVLATISTTHTAALRGHGVSAAVALTGGYHLAFTIAAALVLAAIVIGLLALRPERADETAGASAHGVAADTELEPAYLREAA